MTSEREPTRLPLGEMLALVPMTELEVAEMVEKYINFVDKEGRSVRLPDKFVKAFMKRDDSLPRVHGFSQLPILLPNGRLLTGDGLDRKYGIIFRVPEELDSIMPKPSECDDDAAIEAMNFLANEWLVDVAADSAGKCVLIALGMTIIERMTLPKRPCFFVTAGKRGTGKTTALHMVSQAVLGYEAVAAAWSPNREERRKALFAYLDSGLPLLIWDNIARGSFVSCPSIEAALTTEIYSDRVLGVSEIRRVPAYTVQCFTGNNIAPRGDLASRALVVRLGADRPDPENRKFEHTKPIDWTLTHRGRILASMYTIMLANMKRADRRPADTRFKEWLDLIGSAVERAADLIEMKDAAGAPLRFTNMFLQEEEEGEEASGSAEVLSTLRERWPDLTKEKDYVPLEEGIVQDGWFQARDVADVIKSDMIGSDFGAPGFRLYSGLEQISDKPLSDVTPTIINWLLQGMVDAPVRIDNEVLLLRRKPNRRKGTYFRVEVVPQPGDDVPF